MNDIPKITLDNNCVINLLDRSSFSATSIDALMELMRLGMSGKLDIAITTRVRADLSNDSNDNRRQKMLKSAEMFPVIGTVARWGTSVWGNGDIWGDEKTRAVSNEIQALLFPSGIDRNSSTFSNKTNDVDHLLGHLINGRDIFLTDDGGILKKGSQLKTTLGIIVMSPMDCWIC